MRTQYSQARDVNPYTLRFDLQLTVGGTGAITAVRGFGLSDAILVAAMRNSAGNYTLTLDQQYGGKVLRLGGGVQRVTGAVLTPVRVSGDGNASPAIIFETRIAAGTATDPSTGDIIELELVIDELGQVP